MFSKGIAQYSGERTFPRVLCRAREKREIARKNGFCFRSKSVSYGYGNVREIEVQTSKSNKNEYEKLIDSSNF